MKWMVNILFWLQAFASPVILCAMIGFATGRESALWILLGAGVITGIIVAEYIRKRIGLSAFFARLYSHPPQTDKDIKKENHATTNK